jgi:hypothetical protein
MTERRFCLAGYLILLAPNLLSQYSLTTRLSNKKALLSRPGTLDTKKKSFILAKGQSVPWIYDISHLKRIGLMWWTQIPSNPSLSSCSFTALKSKYTKGEYISAVHSELIEY